MSLTRLDCHFFRGKHPAHSSASYVALNPDRRPGSLVVAGSATVRESIGSQVACKLALEHFIDGVLEYFDKQSLPGEDGNLHESELSVEVLEAAFRKANTSVYSFGHKLAAGGRMAASLLGLVVEDNVVAAGRVGQGSAYLFRGKELFPFFDNSDPSSKSAPTYDGYVGANSLVAVELASVPIQEADRIFVFSANLNAEREAELSRLAATVNFNLENPCENIVRHLFADDAELAFAMLSRIGPDTIYLGSAAAVS